jgi:hypothetical protein
MKTIKLSLNTFVRGTKNKNSNPQECIKKINTIVERCNLITDDLYMFLRSYILYCYDNNIYMPTIDENLLTCMLSVITFKSTNSGRKITVNNELIKKLTIFYEKYISKYHTKKDFAYLSHIFKYTVVTIVTNIKNNITYHFYQHLKNYILFYFKTNKIKFTTKCVQKALNIICNGKVLNWNDIDKFHINTIVKIIRNNYLPNNLLLFCMPLGYFLKADPTDFLKYMIKMNREIENYNNSNKQYTSTTVDGLLLHNDTIKNTHKLYQWLPRKASLIPEHIPIDTTIIIDILETKHKSYKKKDNWTITLLWAKYFYYLYENTNRIENKKFTFNNLIYTDGYSVSILYNSKNKNSDNREIFTRYITDLNNEELDKLKSKQIIGVDPGKRQLVTMIDNNRRKVRYSALQRRSECKFKQKEKALKRFRSDIKNTVETIERELCNYSYKTTNFNECIELIKIRQKYQKILFDHYKSKIYRKYKFTTYINVQKSEASLVNEIKRKYGENICLAYGNWSITKQMRNYIPTKGIGLRKSLAKHFEIYLVDEFRTSICCHNCKHENENFMKRKNPRPYKTNTIYVNSLLRCKNVNCSKYWDRDINGALNIRELAERHINGQSRPIELQRSRSI